MTQLLPPKKEVALALLERSNVDVYLDPRAKGVVVPPQFRKEPRLILKIGLNMPVPIPDLRLDDESMSCTLSFNRAKFFCVVPWSSVFAMVGDDGRGMVWPDDVPQELAGRAPGEEQRPSPVQAAPPPPPESRGKGKRAGESVREVKDETASERNPNAKKKPKKKKDEAQAKDAPARPMLVAVPPPEKSAPRLEKVAQLRSEPKAEPARESRPDASRPAAEASEEARPRATGPIADRPPVRPKRELPPYLRVVK